MTSAGFQYQGILRRAIQRFKYNGEYQRGHDLGQRLSDRLLSDGLVKPDQVEALIPVPLHPRRYRARGFNQAEILARSVGEALDVPVLDLLERVRNTTPQVNLRANQRRDNVDAAFQVSRDRDVEMKIHGRSLLLIDDVMTTGSTLAACALALEEAGAKRLYGLTLAREQ
jgi:ComF family protein